MKRKIFETMEKIERKCVLCLMLAGFTAINTGFSAREEEIPEEPIAIEETSSIEPTAIAVGENGRLALSADDELTRALTEVVENSLVENSAQADPFEVPPPIEEEWWHFTLKDEPYPDTYFTFPVTALQQ